MKQHSLIVIASLMLTRSVVFAQSMPADYDGVLKTLGKQGDLAILQNRNRYVKHRPFYHEALKEIQVRYVMSLGLLPEDLLAQAAQRRW
jgi:hypothetical protein